MPQQLLTLSYTGHVLPGEVRECLEKIQTLLPDLQPGFRLLTDFTDMSSMDSGCVSSMQQIMDLCDDRHLAMVVRIIPDAHKDIGVNIMSLFHYTRAVVIVTCASRDEAERTLAG